MDVLTPARHSRVDSPGVLTLETLFQGQNCTPKLDSVRRSDRIHCNPKDLHWSDPSPTTSPTKDTKHASWL